MPDLPLLSYLFLNDSYYSINSNAIYNGTCDSGAFKTTLNLNMLQRSSFLLNNWSNKLGQVNLSQKCYMQIKF